MQVFIVVECQQLLILFPVQGTIVTCNLQKNRETLRGLNPFLLNKGISVFRPHYLYTVC
jgi:hypothetical protein